MQLVPKPKLDWTNIIFFGSTALLAVVALPIYAFTVGLKPIDWILFGIMAFLTMLATTMGHHRLFAHKAFKAHPAVQFLCLFFGAAAFEGSVVNWASEHRYHHRYTDTDQDPYDIKKGFWYAHMGWFLKDRIKADYSNVKDLTSNPVIKHQHDYWIYWAIGAGVLTPMLIGLAFGSLWGAFFLAVWGRMFFIHHCVFLINSACHMFGKPTYDLNGSARDSWVCAVLTNGEGYHSYHHRFPSDYRNGIKWYHWDPTKWVINGLSRLGLTSDLLRIPEMRILEARSEVEKHHLVLSLEEIQKHPMIHQALVNIHEFHESLKVKLHDWDVKTLEYKKLCREIAHDSAEKIKAQAVLVQKAREDFLEKREEWIKLIENYRASLLAA